MPRLDMYHGVVKRALLNDGWTITHDPMMLMVGTKRVYVDLGASTLLSAIKQERKIAVEVKSFIGASDVHDLEQAVGQYVLYRKILDHQEPERTVYIAVTETVFESTLNSELGQMLLSDQTIRVVVFDEEREVITRWIPA